MPEVSTRHLSDEIVSEGVAGKDWALANERRAIHIRVRTHVLSMPVQRRTISMHHVHSVHYHSIALAYLYIKNVIILTDKHDY